uniref:Uncharacterized protein n=1 Tax=Romanomermis culicivorax TaxID=13658 RepID=A0A915I0N4_ROMCU
MDMINTQWYPKNTTMPMTMFMMMVMVQNLHYKWTIQPAKSPRTKVTTIEKTRHLCDDPVMIVMM